MNLEVRLCCLKRLKLADLNSLKGETNSLCFSLGMENVSKWLQIEPQCPHIHNNEEMGDKI